MQDEETIFNVAIVCMEVQLMIYTFFGGVKLELKIEASENDQYWLKT